METISVPSHASAFDDVVAADRMRVNAPAVFAASAHERTSSAYTFISTERVLDGLRQAGFVPVDVRQAPTRTGSALHARHVVRLRRRFESIALRDSIPEIVFLNSHDGTTAYQLRAGLYRVVCMNGLIVSTGAFPAFHVAHRGGVVGAVISAAVQMGERFGQLAAQVERMERTILDERQQLRFAERALALRFPDTTQAGMAPSELLTVRRQADSGRDLWTLLNVVQCNLLVGGLPRRSVSGRLTRTRRITSIRENVRLNCALWDLATEVLAA